MMVIHRCACGQRRKKNEAQCRFCKAKGVAKPVPPAGVEITPQGDVLLHTGDGGVIGILGQPTGCAPVHRGVRDGASGPVSALCYGEGPCATGFERVTCPDCLEREAEG